MITKLDKKQRTIVSYAIRKLTPRECFRLMGVWDAVIDEMQSTVALVKKMAIKWQFPKHNDDSQMAISATQQYKQAGNSIVVDVLVAILEQLYYPKERKAPEQMDLFADFFGQLPEGAPKVECHNLVTTFSGYDSQYLAYKRLEQLHPVFKCDLVAWSEIDKYAIQMHDLIFPECADRNLGDVTKADWGKLKGMDIDMLTYSSPCQDISQAGKQMGLEAGSGTRSALLWNVVDAIEALHPRFLLQENVAALVSQKFMPDFKKWLKKLEDLGYVNYYSKLNARDFGIPQNRDRIFCLSIRKDVAIEYHFPEPQPLEMKLEDVLEDEVDLKYFKKDDAVSKFLVANDKDDAVFTQFALPPRHEDAMFVKTYLRRWMEANDMWGKSNKEMEDALADMKTRLFPYEWRTSAEMQDADFVAEYDYNVKRERDEPEWYELQKE